MIRDYNYSENERTAEDGLKMETMGVEKALLSLSDTHKQWLFYALCKWNAGVD